MNPTIESTLPGHPFIAYRQAQLFVEDTPVSQLIAQHGTPLFVYSQASMLGALKAYQDALAGRQALICYAMKANSTLSILKLFSQSGCGFDIVSIGELERVLAVGGDPGKIIFSGVGKTRLEMRRALEVGIACFNVESEAELIVLSEVAAAMGLRAPVSIRINPNVDPKTHPYISTGLKANKFGIAHERALDVYRQAAALPGLRVKGIDFHIGSQITTVAPYLDAVDRLLDLVQSIEAAGIEIEHLDFGGGLGIQYEDVQAPKPAELFAPLLAKLDARGFGHKAVLIEPGRSLVGNAGLCATQVLYLKPGEEKNFCIVDAAMNDLPRPAMYQAFHGIVPIEQQPEREKVVYEVVGPVCESGDWLGHARALSVKSGEHLAVLSAGAYCSAMSSNYNSRGRSAELLVSGSQARLIAQRESVQSLFQREQIGL